METLPARFSKSSLFSGLTSANLVQLVDNAVKKSYASQEIIVHQEDVWPYLFFVEEGNIHATKESPEGRAFIATTLKSGDIFWGLAFFIEDAPMPIMLQAKSHAVIHVWRREYLVPLIQANGMMSWNLCQIMIRRMQLASDIVEDLAFQPIMGRLAGLLLELSDGVDSEYIARELTLEEMAARIGTTREMVCRHLYRFAEKGAIQINRTELKIQDRETLLKQAGK